MQYTIQDRFSKFNLRELKEIFAVLPPHKSRLLDNLIVELGDKIENKEKEDKEREIKAIKEQIESCKIAINTYNQMLKNLTNN